MGKFYKLFLVVVILLIPIYGMAQDSTAQESQAPESQVQEPQPQESQAQETQAPEATNPTGATAFAQAVATHSNLGAIYNEGIGVGYNITEHFGGDVGIPLYTVQSPYSIVTTHDWRWTTLVGDAFVDLRYTTKWHGLDATSILTGTIPISSPERVFTTGRFGGDWYNHVSKHFAGITPFINFGAATGTMDRYVLARPYNIARPYQVLGFNANGEAGVSFTILKHYSIGASAYGILPFGRQKVFSRLVAPDSAIAGDANHNRYWNSAFETIGDSKIARDNGYSGWVDVARIKNLVVEAGYNYSVHYRWGSAYLMLKFDGTSLIRFLTATD